MSPGLPARAEGVTEAMGFATTHWSVVLAARAGEGEAAAAALARLCAAYWYPLYAFVRSQGARPPEAGKFRSFLLVCLKNFLANERERAQAQRRGGGQPLLPLESGEAETRYALEPADPRTPEALFERRWAFALLERTIAELRREYATGDKRQLFEDLQGFLPNRQGTVSRADLAAKRGVSLGAIDVAVHRLRQRFGALLRQQVAQTVSSAAEVDDEIRHLISVLGA